jgi:tRNA A-37 threonylcarbamoyl transferase component Bud32
MEQRHTRAWVGQSGKAAPDVLRRSHKTAKAHIRVADRAGEKVVVKQFRTRNPLIRFAYAPVTLHRESRAYARLAGLPGFARCYGANGTASLVLQYVCGRSLSACERFTVPASVFDRLDQLVASMHARGVANGDLHRSNILLTDAGEVYIIDFSSAVVARNPARPGLLTRFFMKLDLQAAAKIRARYLGLARPRPTGMFGCFYRFGKVFKAIFKKIGLH